MTGPVVEASGLDKRFGDVDVLNGVDLSVRPDETTLLLGPNGSGKTVLLSCLAGGLSPTRGSVEVFDRPPREVRSAFTFGLQDGLAMRELTGRENARFYEELHPRATGEWRDVADALELDALDRRVRDYSGGMVRKLELAITLGVDVPLYFLDEPTAELDMTTVETFRSLVEEKRAAGRTVVATSHRPGDLALADRIAFVREGRIVESGDPADLMTAAPRVVRVDGAGATSSGSREYVRGGRFFESGGERRGFLAPDADVEALRSATGDATTVSVTEPGATDLFNYYVHVRPAAETGGSGAERPAPGVGGGD